jgi:GGDEF domain-containing protein
MSAQGPVIVISETGAAPYANALAEAGHFPVVESDWDGALDAIADIQPAAIVADDGAAHPAQMSNMAAYASTLSPYVPLIVTGGARRDSYCLPLHAPVDPKCLAMRLHSALRVRASHAAVMRRLAGNEAGLASLYQFDPLNEAVVLLAGRGRDYPQLSVALGAHAGVIGSLTIEAAAQQLRAREVDGVLIGGGFGPRHIDALLTAMAEDARYRNLPIVICGAENSWPAGQVPGRELPNLEWVGGETLDAVQTLLPLAAQQAREAYLLRAIASLDADGRLDPLTGLLTMEAFARDLDQAITDAHQNGSGLSAASFAFPNAGMRVTRDAARILARLMRNADFATQREDGTLIAIFTQTSLHAAHVVTRRLASVIKHTLVSGEDHARVAPDMTLATLKPGDDAQSLLMRLTDAMPPVARRAS